MCRFFSNSLVNQGLPWLSSWSEWSMMNLDLYCCLRFRICSLGRVVVIFFFTQYGTSWSRCWLKDLVFPHHSSFSHALNSAGLFSQKRRRVINRAWAHNRVSQPSWEVSQITICSTSALSPPPNNPRMESSNDWDTSQLCCSLSGWLVSERWS